MLLQPLSDLVGDVFAAHDLPRDLGRVIAADRPDLADVQCNGAMQAAKIAGKPPRQIAEAIVSSLQDNDAAKAMFAEITVAGPGFLNFKLRTDYLARQLALQNDDAKFGFELEGGERKIVVDFCGLNIAKAMLVSHTRPTIIGDALQRLFRFAGHDVVSDVHLGDWGLPMGIVINEIQRDQPDLPYFKDDYNGAYPEEPPFSITDLASLYPRGSARTKNDEEERQKVRIITAKLQEGHPGYRALWKHIVHVSIMDLRQKTDALDVYPDYWYGESHADPYIGPMIEDLKRRNLAVLDDGAFIVRVAREDDKFEVPPVILVKRDGGVGYQTTDIATIIQRQKDFDPDHIVYVVDQRQSLHFIQVFRAAELAGYGPKIHHHFVGFGTMNGKDGKPFKTRDGGIPTMQEFLEMLTEKASERLRDIGMDQKLGKAEFDEVAQRVGFAAMKYGDLMNAPQSDYIFDLDKFVSFEGKTGPYIQYTIVRVNALLQKASDQNISKGEFALDAAQQDIALLLLQFPDAIEGALNDYAPNILCDYLFRLAQSVNRFYQNVPILVETDHARRGAALAVMDLSARILTQGLDLIGIKVPSQM